MRVLGRARIALNCIVAAAMVAAAPSGWAAEQPFEAWLGELRAEALERGIAADTLDAALAEIQPIERVIELDRRQPEFTLTFEQYMARVVSAERVRQGREKLAEHRALLDEIARKYNVQPRFIVALWGIETNFGRTTGGFPVIAALATLAWDGRRSAYFRGQLLDALTILDEGHITADAMIGSWAGAMGQNQFMPSSFRAYAVDHDGDGRRDIWTTHADVFASTANYLAEAGWQGDQTWGRAVRLPTGFDPALTGLDVQKKLSEWQALGVRRADGGDLPARDLMASVLVPAAASRGDGKASEIAGPAFVVYANYRAIMRWNRAHFFAMAVGHLADRLGEGG